jgi:L-ascorbate metabolism protein UlaG (beta-lactamase superfamily)
MKPLVKGILAVAGICLLLTCSSVEKRPLSDHSDGHRFYNPTQPEMHGLWTALKFLASAQPAPWPEFVENRPDSHLDCGLASDQAAVTFVNHATVLIQLAGYNILTDPMWSERASPLSWIGPKRVREPGIAFDALPRIDLVVVSHNHYDHMDLDTLKRLSERFAPRILVPFGDKALLESAGIKRVEELDWWEKVELTSETQVTFTPTQHFSSRGLFDRNKSLWGSYMIRNRGHLIYFGGDAGYSIHYAEINARFGPADLAFLPIGAYEPNWFMGPVHMNPAEAVKAHKNLASRQSVAIHFGTFRMTEEAIDRPVLDLKEALASQGLAEHDFAVLEEGRTRMYILSNNVAAKRAALESSLRSDTCLAEPLRKDGFCGMTGIAMSSEVLGAMITSAVLIPPRASDSP